MYNKPRYVAAFVWCPGFSLEDENEVLLACTSENGVVSLWRVRGNILDDQPILINTTELQTPVHSLCWHSVSSDSGMKLMQMFVVRLDGLIYLCSSNSGRLDDCEQHRRYRENVLVQEELRHRTDTGDSSVFVVGRCRPNLER